MYYMYYCCCVFSPLPEARCVKAEGQLHQLQTIPDLQDEIDYTRQELEKALRSLKK